MQPGTADPETLTCRGREVAARQGAAIWMPDFSLFLAAVTLAYTLLIFDGWHKLFRDADAGWHVRTGESILATGRLPRTDPYSFTRSGMPWMDWEWASDVAAGAAHRLAGLRGVALLFALAIAACTWLWVRLSWAVGGDFLLTCLLAAPMLSTVNMHWLARPHVFGWLLLLGWVWWLERPRVGSFRRMDALVAAGFGFVWANVHGSFFLAPLTALLYAAGVWLTRWVWAPTPASTKQTQEYLFAALFAFSGSLVNPYGIALHRHVVGYLSDPDLLARIGEFQSFNFHAAGAGWVLVTAGIGALGACAALATRRLDRFLVAAFFLAVALRSARGLPVLALVVLPMANAGFTAVLERTGGLRFRERLDAALEYSARLRIIDQRLAGWALVPVLMLACALGARSADAGFPPDDFPVAASAAVDHLPPDARILAPDKFGGYLIYRFEGSRKVYFDGRSDFYGTAFMKEYLRLMEARPGWQEIARRLRFTHALLPVDAPLAAALESAGWKQTYKDNTAALFAAPGNTHGS